MGYLNAVPSPIYDMQATIDSATRSLFVIGSYRKRKYFPRLNCIISSQKHFSTEDFDNGAPQTLVFRHTRKNQIRPIIASCFWTDFGALDFEILPTTSTMPKVQYYCRPVELHQKKAKLSLIIRYPRAAANVPLCLNFANKTINTVFSFS